MNKWLAGLLVILMFAFLGCGKGREVEVLQITEREPALDASGVSALQTLLIAFNFPIDHTGMTKDNFFTEYAALGPSHTAGDPTVQSLSWTPESKTLKIEISGWSGIPAGAIQAASTSGKAIHIIPREGKIKDVFNNVLDVSTPLWRCSQNRYMVSVAGTVEFANTSLPMKGGPVVYYAAVSDPSTKLGTTAASTVDGTYSLDNVPSGDYQVGIENATGWNATYEGISIPSAGADVDLDIDLYPSNFDILRIGSENLNAVGSFGANRYVVGEGSSGLILRSTNDVDWVELPYDRPLTDEALVFIFENNVNGTTVVDGSGSLYNSKTPEVYAEWQFLGDATDETVVDFLSQDVFYFVTGTGKLLESPIGPLDFTDITPPGQFINAVEIARPVSTYEALICGDNGYVAQIDYQGNIVKDLRGNLPASENLMAVASNYGNDPVNLYAVICSSGAIYKSEDGGITWNKVISGIPAALNDTWMFYGLLPGQDFSDIGMYVVGSNGLIMRKKK